MKHVTFIIPKSQNRADFITEAKSGAFEGCVAAFRTFDSVSITGLIDRELVEVLPTSLRFLSHLGQFLSSALERSIRALFNSIVGAGYDQVDVKVCTEFNIRVSNVPTAVDDSTADTNIYLIIGALRGFNRCEHIFLIDMYEN